ncbi:HIT-like protein [Schizopora paradoxa]|uniref:HIT-like protein n=1 Tax=Schizopora paradoxa TaxID=27342 RepID=A0A0H2R5F5_9AGAM|nr:HIT-like protein [Schizopora paradoxa]
MSGLLFSTIEVTRQAFYRNALSYAIVNLKPIVPGHVLVIPTRVVPRISDLTPNEVSNLFASVQDIGRVIERVYKADALTIACQDGTAAGQSIPHVHVHILPRKFAGDIFEGQNDEIYPALEKSESALPKDLQTSTTVADAGRRAGQVQTLKVDADDSRPPRTVEEMVKEAEWLKTFFESSNTAVDGESSPSK